ncbi:aquaporin, Major intrinsic protein family [Ceratobasidium sp. AG-Ba]|nr:aquaporin, Major intrinsic protein family [Ceratobasidium sp. AG-Ba]
MAQRPAGPTMSSSFSVPSIAYRGQVADRTTGPDVKGKTSDSGPSSSPAHYAHPRSGLSKIRYLLREPSAEFLGTMLLVMFGNAANCQVVLSSSTAVASSPKGDYLALSFGWSAGIALGAWVSAGISGGHINPAITIAMAVFRGFSWKKVPGFIFAQMLGGWVGASLVYANYYRAIHLFDANLVDKSISHTAASLFATFPAPYLSNAQSFFQEFLATAILVLMVLAATDKSNGPPPNGLVPLVLFITMLGISSCFGMQTSFSLNPARDLGPRLMCWMVGYGREVWNFRSQYWIYAPTMGPIVGALTGTALYDILVFTGHGSIFNKGQVTSGDVVVQDESDVSHESSGGRISV